MRNVFALLNIKGPWNKAEHHIPHHMRMDIPKFFEAHKLEACFYRMRKRHRYSDSVVDPKTIWPNKLAVEEPIKSWPCNKECFTYIESHLVTRQARRRQFQRAHHVGGQGKSWLTVVDVMKLLTGQRKTHCVKHLWAYKQDWQGRRVERRKQQKKRPSPKEGQAPGHKKKYENPDWTQTWRGPGHT